MPATRDWDWRLPGDNFLENIDAEFESPFDDWSGILKRGLYFEQLQYLTKHVDRQNILLLVMEDWISDPIPTMAKICDFLQIPATIDEIRVAHQRPDKEPVTTEAIEKLERYYEQPNQQLFDWLGYQIDW